MPKPPAPPKRTGWKFTTALLIAAVSVVLFGNVILLGWALRKNGGNFGDFVELYDGSCDYVQARWPWIHLPVNICSAVLLACSTTAMQICSAPTRSDIDRAHPTCSLEIGILGYRNWKYISARRKVIWALLILSSLPISFLSVAEPATWHSRDLKRLTTLQLQLYALLEDYDS